MKIVRQIHHASGAILIYVLLVFATMGTLLALMVSTFAANNRFAERTVTETRLRLDNQATVGKVFGLYRNDPRHPQLALLGNSRRSVAYLPYSAKQEGYVYPNRSDLISIDGRLYPDPILIPTTVTVRNLPDSLGDLMVVARSIRLDTGLIESSSATRILKPTGATAVESVFTVPDLTIGEQRFVRRYELLLFSDAHVLYEAVPDSNRQLLSNTMKVAVTSRNASALGANQVASSTSVSYDVRPPSFVYAAPDVLSAGATGSATQSSWNYPGLSTAFVDTMDGPSPNGWSTSGGSPTYANGDTVLPAGATLTYVGPALTDDFDARVTLSGAASSNVLQVRVGSNTYKVGVATVTRFQGSAAACSTNAGTASSYVAYLGSSVPANVGDGSAICAASYPNQYLPFTAAASSYTLRLERRGILLNAFACEGTTKDCDRADQFVVVNASPYAIGSGTATLAVAATSSSTVQYARVARLSTTPVTYSKTLVFERTLKVKQVEIMGSVPPAAGLSVQLTNAATSCSANCTTSYGSQMFIVPTTPLSTDRLTISLSFASNSGDLSEIPFIHGYRVYYE